LRLIPNKSTKSQKTGEFNKRILNVYASNAPAIKEAVQSISLFHGTPSTQNQQRWVWEAYETLCKEEGDK
jgi:hypothetical protein